MTQDGVNGFFQVESRQTVQQAEVEELGEPERPPVQHGCGQLLGDGWPPVESGRIQQSTRLQHAQTTDQTVVRQPQPGRLEPDEHILRVRADWRQTQQQQLVRRKRPAAQSQPIIAWRVFQVSYILCRII